MTLAISLDCCCALHIMLFQSVSTKLGPPPQKNSIYGGNSTMTFHSLQLFGIYLDVSPCMQSFQSSTLPLTAQSYTSFTCCLRGATRTTWDYAAWTSTTVKVFTLTSQRQVSRSFITMVNRSESAFSEH